MKYFSAAFTPTKNRRLNELIGVVIFAGAVLLFLALVSYAPTDPSLNTAAPGAEGRSPHNWIGITGALIADLLLQVGGISTFLLPVLLTLLAVRWFFSRKVELPEAKAIGAILLLLFIPGLLGLLPWRLRWSHALPIEGLTGRIIADALLHYFNQAGAYIVCLLVISIALYLSTAFSFGALRLWFMTRFSFIFALWNKFTDWRETRRKAKAQKELEAKRAAQQNKPTVSAQLIPKRQPPVPPARPKPEEFIDEPEPARPKSGVERMLEEMDANGGAAPFPEGEGASNVAITNRADDARKVKTTLPKVAGSYKMPSSALLARPDEHGTVDEDELRQLADVLVSKCAEFGVTGQVTQINPGPVVTTFEFKPDAGVKYSRIVGLNDDLSLALRAESILIERMAGKSTVGIQVPNHNREIIRLREVIESPEFVNSKSRLTLATGKDINGRITVADLATMPHLLVAGSTGSGKSVAINAFIMSLLYKATPDQVRLILVDPKRVELGVYEGVPHLYVPIITEAKVAAFALRNAVREMERRLKLLAEKGARNIDQYNKLFDETPSLFGEDSDNPDEKPLPYIVIIIDELADLMMIDQSNVEESITRLAQMARAVGIHLVLATQRPSVDVITGLIKANFPARISFRVSTKVDSRTILDGNGAESLLGRGDMLYLPSGSARLVRLHAPYVAEKEIAAAVEFWKAQATAQYEQSFLEAPKEEGSRAAANGDTGNGEFDEEGDDELFQDAVKLVLEFGKASTSLLQRRLRIGYGRAAHLIDLMEQDGIVGPADGPKPREVLKRPDWLNEVEDSLR